MLVESYVVKAYSTMLCVVPASGTVHPLSGSTMDTLAAWHVCTRVNPALVLLLF